jgi:hypothetical protein
MAITEETKQEEVSHADGEKLMQSLWKTVWRLRKKQELELLYSPSISLLHI